MQIRPVFIPGLTADSSCAEDMPDSKAAYRIRTLSSTHKNIEPQGKQDIFMLKSRTIREQ
jgi:hypothetical protein